jgi:hypothetical protein
MDNQLSQPEKKSVESKDARKLRSNRHIGLELPPMPSEDRKPLKAPEKIGFRGHGSYSSEVVEKVLKLRREGLSFSQIGQLRGLPGKSTLWRWQKEYPDFAEESREAYDDYVNDEAEQMLELSKTMPEVKGLKGMSKVIAIDKRIMRTLEIASRRQPRIWGKDTIGGGEAIILEVAGLDPEPKYHLPGSPDGQPAAALKAQEEWKKQQANAEGGD